MELTIYDKDIYNQRIEKGNFCTLLYQEGWDGLGNNLDVINFMDEKGWDFIFVDVQYYPHNKGECIADDTHAELLFKRRK